MIVLDSADMTSFHSGCKHPIWIWNRINTTLNYEYHSSSF